MRARMRLGGGRANLNPPRRMIIGRVYEKVKPISEWRQEDDHESLLVYLPGFRKEFIKVTTEYGNILRIRGECLVAGNKWNRFLEDYKIPETCKKRGIRAKFDGGILTITMPKKINGALTTTGKPEEPMKTAKRATDSAKSSSLTSNAIRPPQPLAADGDGRKPKDQGKTLPKLLDRTEGSESSIEIIRNTKTDLDSESESESKMKYKLDGYTRMVKMLTMGGILKEGRMVAVNVVAMLLLVAAALGLMYHIPLEPQAKGIN